MPPPASDSSTLDVLIIGQGLAGSLLALALLERGQRIRILDDGHRSSASMAAAGLVNPLGGMRFNRLPHLEACLASAQTRYLQLERQFKLSLWHPIPMVRLFRSEQQMRFYRRQADDPAAAPYLGGRFAAGESGHRLNDPHGGFRQRGTGYVAVAKLLTSLRTWFRDQGLLVEQDADPANLQLLAGGVRHAGMTARRLVFCQGRRSTSNPWFDWLPLQPAKGEILTLDCDEPLPDEIINAAHWLIPLVEGGWRLGATLDREHLDERPTDAGRRVLLTGLEQLLGRHLPVRIRSHLAGVRPNTSDRQPLLGAHPQHPELCICNGFGGRGSLTIPWYSERFADWLLGHGPLPAGADIRRCR
jgi:glycine/D-amino acid oxidase-like deaminating enzyme